MVCSRCGTQVEPLDNFCRNCGVRLTQSAGLTAADKSSRTAIGSAASSLRTKRLSSEARRDATLAPAHEKGIGGATLFLGAVLLVAVAAASVYLATHVLRRTGQGDRPLIADAPTAPSRDEINRRGDTA